ncbi:GatB/YqeY domain-containing protein [Atopobium fossor]|uniref:GatB/YqeY domain-containing protein n=1 Tax=Atopobium fossor TaxID=39487 RepID=UPI00040EA49A|nr:GatB/YqeY domain-containing protein [Atopobium fossor]
MQKAELLELIKQAMKAQDKTRLSILRQINQAIKQIEVDERRDVTEADIVACIKKLQKVTNEELEALRGASADSYTDRIESLASQADILTSLLPKQLSGSELEALADKLIASLGASSKRDMGKVMGALTKQTNGNFDKPAAAAYIGSKLA